MLASSLLSDSDLDDVFQSRRPRLSGVPGSRLRTGIKSVDDLLGGAYMENDGVVVAVSGDRGTGRTGVGCMFVPSNYLFGLLALHRSGAYFAHGQTAPLSQTCCYFSVLFFKLQGDF